MQKTILFLLFIMIPNLLISEMLTSPCSIPIELDYVLDCFLEEQTHKELIPVIKNAEGECGIERVSFLFDYFGTLNISSARRLILDTTKTLLDKLNAKDKVLNPFFAACFPLTADNIVIRIRVRTNECGFIYPKLDNIAYVTLIDGFISYGTLNSFTYEIDNLRIETYASVKK